MGATLYTRPVSSTVVYYVWVCKHVLCLPLHFSLCKLGKSVNHCDSLHAYAFLLTAKSSNSSESRVDGKAKLFCRIYRTIRKQTALSLSVLHHSLGQQTAWESHAVGDKENPRALRTRILHQNCWIQMVKYLTENMFSCLETTPFYFWPDEAIFNIEIKMCMC